MNEQELKVLATELAKNITLNTPEDLNQLSRLLKKVTVEATLSAEAIETVYPDTKIQRCIVHLVRNSLKFCPMERLQSDHSRFKNCVSRGQ